MQWYDLIRLGTCVISLAAMYLLGQSWRRRNKEYSDRLKDFWWAMNAAMFTAFLGSLEAVIRDRPASWSLLLSFCTAVVTFKAAYSKDPNLIKVKSEDNK